MEIWKLADMPVRQLLTIPLAVLSVVAVAGCGEVTIDSGGVRTAESDIHIAGQ